MRIDPGVQQWHIVYPVPIYQMLSITYRDRSAGSSPSPLVDPSFNPNLTGMFWLLNSTGMRVLYFVLHCFVPPFLLHKMAMPVQLVGLFMAPYTQ